jgi:hypothetical protein
LRARAGPSPAKEARIHLDPDVRRSAEVAIKGRGDGDAVHPVLSTGAQNPLLGVVVPETLTGEAEAGGV